MTYIIVMSHGNLAAELLNSAKMIAGELKSFQAVGMTAADGLEGTQRKLTQALKNVPQGANVLILADLFGGTPCNVAMLTAAQSHDRIKVISGVNLGMVLECAMNSDRNGLVDHLLTVGQQGIRLAETQALTDDGE